MPLYFTADLRSVLLPIPDDPPPPGAVWCVLLAGSGDGSGAEARSDDRPAPAEPEAVWLLTPDTLARIWAQVRASDARWAAGDYDTEKLAIIAERMRPILAWADEHLSIDECRRAAIRFEATGGKSCVLRPPPGVGRIHPWDGSTQALAAASPLPAIRTDFSSVPPPPLRTTVAHKRAAAAREGLFKEAV